MGPKSLGILGRTLLFGVFLIIPSSVYADAFSFTVVNLNNIKITSSGGNITFGEWQANVIATTGHNIAGVIEDNHTSRNSNDLSKTSAGDWDPLTDAVGLSHAMTLSTGATTTVDLRNCSCLAAANVRATVLNTFMVTGPDGPVGINMSATLGGIQSLFTNEFGVLSESHINVAFLVDSFVVFSTEFHRLIGTNSMDSLQWSQQVARAITVQSNTQHTVSIIVQAESFAVDAVPEPASVVLLLSGLGALIGVVKRRRQFQ